MRLAGKGLPASRLIHDARLHDSKIDLLPEVGIVLDVSDEVGQNRVSRGFAESAERMDSDRPPSCAGRVGRSAKPIRGISSTGGGATVPGRRVGHRQARTANFWHQWHSRIRRRCSPGCRPDFPSPTLPQAAPIPDAA